MELFYSYLPRNGILECGPGTNSAWIFPIGARWNYFIHILHPVEFWSAVLAQVAPDFFRLEHNGIILFPMEFWSAVLAQVAPQFFRLEHDGTILFISSTHHRSESLFHVWTYTQKYTLAKRDKHMMCEGWDTRCHYCSREQELIQPRSKFDFRVRIERKKWDSLIQNRTFEFQRDHFRVCRKVSIATPPKLNAKVFFWRQNFRVLSDRNSKLKFGDLPFKMRFSSSVTR